MRSSEIELLRILADGEMHSGQELARASGVSRTAIWKQLNKIREKNLEIKAIKGQGYQLAGPLELLDEHRIIEQLRPKIRRQLVNFKLYYETGSTNRLLMDRLGDEPVHGRVVIAEYQSAGRGRGNNRWLSGLGTGLYLSLGWHFDSLPETFSALSLATGAVLARSIRQLCGSDIQLKWPNDLVFAGSKLGGILIESRGQHAGAADVVIGIGINICLGPEMPGKISQPTTDLQTIYGDKPSRNRLAGIIINNIIELLAGYRALGFENYIEEWRRLDSCRGKKAVLKLANNHIEGTVVDIDEGGNLVMSVAGKRVRYGSGDLSLRLQN